MNLLETRRDIYDFNPQKACWLSPGGVTISAFDHIKTETEISSKNILPYSSLLLFLLLLKESFIYRFIHSQWEEHSLFNPPSFSIFIASPRL